MAEKIDSFKSDSGKIHANEHDAWRDDLDHWLSGKIDNVPIRSDVLAMIVADALNGNHLGKIIAGIKETAPAKNYPLAPTHVPNDVVVRHVPYDKSDSPTTDVGQYRG